MHGLFRNAFFKYHFPSSGYQMNFSLQQLFVWFQTARQDRTDLIRQSASVVLDER